MASRGSLNVRRLILRSMPFTPFNGKNTCKWQLGTLSEFYKYCFYFCRRTVLETQRLTLEYLHSKFGKPNAANVLAGPLSTCQPARASRFVRALSRKRNTVVFIPKQQQRQRQRQQRVEKFQEMLKVDSFFLTPIKRLIATSGFSLCEPHLF